MLSRWCFKRPSQVKKIWVLSVFIGLAACQSTRVPRVIRDLPRLPEQVALSDAQIATLEKRMAERGVEIVSVGQDYLISVPALSLFGNQSPRLTWESYDLLNGISCYLRQFRKVDVNVAAFTSRYISAQREQALSTARAEVVARYLWSQGIESRLLFTQGMGSDKPIVTAARAEDKSPNARVEITFRRAVV